MAIYGYYLAEEACRLQNSTEPHSTAQHSRIPTLPNTKGEGDGCQSSPLAWEGIISIGMITDGDCSVLRLAVWKRGGVCLSVCGRMYVGRYGLYVYIYIYIYMCIYLYTYMYIRRRGSPPVALTEAGRAISAEVKSRKMAKMLKIMLKTRNVSRLRAKAATGTQRCRDRRNNNNNKNRGGGMDGVLVIDPSTCPRIRKQTGWYGGSYCCMYCTVQSSPPVQSPRPQD